MFKCLCGNDITLSTAESMESDGIYSGGSDRVIGSNYGIVTICESCKRELKIELSITDKNW